MRTTIWHHYIQARNAEGQILPMRVPVSTICLERCPKKKKILLILQYLLKQSIQIRVAQQLYWILKTCTYIHWRHVQKSWQHHYLILWETGQNSNIHQHYSEYNFRILIQGNITWQWKWVICYSQRG